MTQLTWVMRRLWCSILAIIMHRNSAVNIRRASGDLAQFPTVHLHFYPFNEASRACRRGSPVLSATINVIMVCRPETVTTLLNFESIYRFVGCSWSDWRLPSPGSINHVQNSGNPFDPIRIPPPPSPIDSALMEKSPSGTNSHAREGRQRFKSARTKCLPPRVID
jgi:hypothetical protein